MESELPPVKEAYWLFASVSFAALLFGMSPRDKGFYAGATEELQHVDDLRLHVDSTYAQVERRLVPQSAPDIAQLIASEARRGGKTIASPAVLEEDFFFVDDGPLTVPEDLAGAVRLFRANPHYVVKVPHVPSLTAGLRSVFA